MDRAVFKALLTPAGQAVMAHAAGLEPTEAAFLSAFTQLQKHHPADLARAALETVLLRRKARAKFTRADSMYFTREGLEMASSEIVSRYRAARFGPFSRVADLCCGIGGDTIGLAALPARQSQERSIAAVDREPLHLDMAEQNIAAYGLKADFVERDLTREPPPAAEAAFFDPGRRAEGRRRFSVRDYRPPLNLIESWLPAPLPLGVKISPGVDLEEIESYDCEIEFVSLDGELKECVLWFGPLSTTRRRASLLTAHGAPATFTPLPAAAAPGRLSRPLAFLYEPDPAILRAGLVVDLAVHLDAAQLDPDIAYLTSGALTPTPFARAYTLEAAMPFSHKRLREALRAMQVGRVTVKKRGSPLDPESLARSLKLEGEEERIVFLTHVQGKPYALIGARAGKV